MGSFISFTVNVIVDVIRCKFNTLLFVFYFVSPVLYPFFYLVSFWIAKCFYYFMFPID